MKLTTTDIRQLGYKKIFSSYLKDSDFIEALNAMYANFRSYYSEIKPYSFIRDKDKFDKLERERCTLLEFVDRVTPFGLAGQDKVALQRCQRSFKNTWSAIWKTASSAISELRMSVEPDIFNAMQILSLKQAYIMMDWEDINFRMIYVTNRQTESMCEKIFYFYNMLFDWAYITQGTELDTDKLLVVLVTDNISDFAGSLSYIKDNMEEFAGEE